MGGMDVTAMNNFRHNLAAAIKNRGVSLRALDIESGVSYPYICRLLNPKDGKPVPSLDVCESLANCFGLTVSTMLLAPREFKRHLKENGKVFSETA